VRAGDPTSRLIPEAVFGPRRRRRILDISALVETEGCIHSVGIGPNDLFASLESSDKETEPDRCLPESIISKRAFEQLRLCNRHTFCASLFQSTALGTFPIHLDPYMEKTKSLYRLLRLLRIQAQESRAASTEGLAALIHPSGGNGYARVHATI
jgi:hypothetical protein